MILKNIFSFVAVHLVAVVVLYTVQCTVRVKPSVLHPVGLFVSIALLMLCCFLSLFPLTSFALKFPHFFYFVNSLYENI